MKLLCITVSRVVLFNQEYSMMSTQINREIETTYSYFYHSSHYKKKDSNQKKFYRLDRGDRFL